MTRVEEIMLECCELNLDEVQVLDKFLDLLIARKRETVALRMQECRALSA